MLPEHGLRISLRQGTRKLRTARRCSGQQVLGRKCSSNGHWPGSRRSYHQCWQRSGWCYWGSWEDGWWLVQKSVTLLLYVCSFRSEGFYPDTRQRRSWANRKLSECISWQYRQSVQILSRKRPEAYQAGCIWGQSTVSQPETSSPTEWGWTRHNDLWTTLSQIAQSRQQLTKCWCKTECRGWCKCYQFGLQPTALYSCMCEGYGAYVDTSDSWLVSKRCPSELWTNNYDILNVIAFVV